MPSDAEVTRQFKAKLRAAFPGHKFSVTRGGENITWTDDGPTVLEVEDAIVATGLVEIHHNYRDERYLRVRDSYGNSVYFDRYNAAERAAEAQRQQQESERRQEQNKHAGQIAAAATKARNAVLNADAPPSSAPSDPETDQKLHAAFEDLRQRAEAETAATEELRRRPSWAPPLLIEGELFDLCVELGLLSKEDAPVARLWATFADPKKPGSVLRHRISHHELPGIVCRGFQLHPGRERQGSFGILFEAQRTKDGTWQFGPRWWLSSASASSRWQTLVGQRALRELELETAAEHGPNYVRFVEQRLQAIVTELEALDIEEKLKTEVRHTRHRQRLRAFELAKARVLEFAGAPDLQMQLAGRQAGFCCNCGKQLTDPISLERGIGPDCYSNKIDFIRSWVREAREAGQEPPVNKIVLYSGMPREFVVEVINAMKEHLP